MTHSNFTNFLAIGKHIKHITALVLFAGIIALPGCGSTKVYTADKTLVYGSNLYNLSNVQRLGSRIEGTLPDGEKVNLERMDKKAINALLDEYSSLLVTTAVEMDDKEFIYQNVRVKKYSDYSKVIKNQQSTMGKINKFMANKKSTQLKLK